MLFLLLEDRRLFCKVGVLSLASAVMLTAPQHLKTLERLCGNRLTDNSPEEWRGGKERDSWVDEGPLYPSLVPLGKVFHPWFPGVCSTSSPSSVFLSFISATAPVLLLRAITRYLTKLHFESRGSWPHSFSDGNLSSGWKRWPLCCLILPRPLHQPTFPPPQCHLCSLTKWHTQTPPSPPIHPSIARSLSLLLRRRLYGRQAWQFCQNHSECVYLKGKWQDMCFCVKDVERGVRVCSMWLKSTLWSHLLICSVLGNCTFCQKEQTELK